MRIYTLAFLFLSSCMSSRESNDYIALLSKTRSQINMAVLEEHQLVCRGYGGALMHDIAEVSQDYLSMKKCDVNSARQLMVSCVEKLKEMINNNSEIRHFLHEYPFPANRIEITIAFVDDTGEHVSDGSVAYASFINGKIKYSKFNRETDKLEKLSREDYAEALRIVQSENHKSTEQHI